MELTTTDFWKRVFREAAGLGNKTEPLEVKVRIFLKDCLEGKAGTITVKVNGYLDFGRFGALFASGADSVVIQEEFIPKTTFKKIYDKRCFFDEARPVKELLYHGE